MEHVHIFTKRNIVAGIAVTLLALFVMFIFTASVPKRENITMPVVADYDSDTEAAERKNLKLGVVPGPYGDMFMETIQPLLAQLGYTTELVYYDDFIRPNFALANKEIDLNMFQHHRYLNSFKFENDLDLTAIAEIPTASMGVFSKRYKSIDDLEEGITVSIPDDSTNLSRALKVLDAAKIIVLNPSIDMARATQNDIVHNPYKVVFTPVEAHYLVKSLELCNLSVINGNFAISGGLNLSEALYNEVLTESYINVIAVRTEDLSEQFVKDIIYAVRSREYVDVIVDADGKYVGFQRPRYFFGVMGRQR